MASILLETEIFHSAGFRACSAAAKGILLDLLELFWQGEGFLADPHGRPWGIEQLARQTGHSPEEIGRAFQELTTGGVLVQTTEGLFFFPPMAKKVQLSQKRRAAALKRWGYLQKDANNAKTMQNGMQTDMQNDMQTGVQTERQSEDTPKASPHGPTADAPGIVCRNLNGHKQLEAIFFGRK